MSSGKISVTYKSPEHEAVFLSELQRIPHIVNLGRIASFVFPLAASAFRISFTKRICSINSPERSSFSPACLPATLKP